MSNRIASSERSVMKNNDAYFKQWRVGIGFSNKNEAQEFFKATDIRPKIDFALIDRRNERVFEILKLLNKSLHKDVSNLNIGDLKYRYIQLPKEKIIDTELILKFNNHGRRCEDVYLSWLRGYAIAGLMVPAIKHIFGVQLSAIRNVGGDDFENIETFKRLPAADLEIDLPSGRKALIEVQAGFQGVNDVKEHKLKEAASVFKKTSIPTVVFHIDALNGQAAIIVCQKLDLKNIDMIKRAQFEGQKVMAIKPEQFNWRLSEFPCRMTEDELF